MPDKKLPTDVERRFNKKFPGENAPLRHVGKFYGASLFVSEGIESSVMIDREEARQFLADELEKARAEERERVEIEKMEGITKNLSFGPKIIKELKGYQASYGIEDRALAEIAGIVKDRVLSDLLSSLDKPLKVK